MRDRRSDRKRVLKGSWPRQTVSLGNAQKERLLSPLGFQGSFLSEVLLDHFGLGGPGKVTLGR